MLAERRVHVTLPVADLDRARGFYEDDPRVHARTPSNPRRSSIGRAKVPCSPRRKGSGLSSGTHTQMALHAPTTSRRGGRRPGTRDRRSRSTTSPASRPSTGSRRVGPNRRGVVHGSRGQPDRRSIRVRPSRWPRSDAGSAVLVGLVRPGASSRTRSAERHRPLGARLEVAQLDAGPSAELVVPRMTAKCAPSSDGRLELPAELALDRARPAPASPAARSSVATRSRSAVAAGIGPDDDRERAGLRRRLRRPRPRARAPPGRARARSRSPASGGRRAARRGRRSGRPRRAPTAGPRRPAGRTRTPSGCSSRARGRGRARAGRRCPSASRCARTAAKWSAQASHSRSTIRGASALSSAIAGSFESSRRSGLRSSRPRSNVGQRVDRGAGSRRTSSSM